MSTPHDAEHEARHDWLDERELHAHDHDIRSVVRETIDELIASGLTPSEGSGTLPPSQAVLSNRSDAGEPLPAPPMPSKGRLSHEPDLTDVRGEESL